MANLEFLSNFMRVTQAITRAERCLALSSNFAVLDTINVANGLDADEDFKRLVRSAVTEANRLGTAFITNNLITDASDAPQTNVHLSDLRMIVAIPLSEHGTIYLDQHIRQGVFERATIERLDKLAKHVLSSDQLGLSTEELTALYNTPPSA